MTNTETFQVGTTIVRGHKVVRFKGSEWHPGTWIALCEAPQGEHHGWVTWRVGQNDEGFWAESGVYFPRDEYEQAFGSYERRD